MSRAFRFEPSPFSDSGQWIKAGFHCHTVNSDGGLTPETTVDRYRAEGFRCLGITDHHQVTGTEAFSGDGFVGIDSTENGGSPDIIGVGISETAPVEGSLFQRTRALAAQGGFTILAHPAYSAATIGDVLQAPDLAAMEIYNAYCDEAYANGIAVELWDMLLGRGRRIWGLAGDDAHLNPRKRYYSDAGRAWVEVFAPELSRDAILSALKRGAFYSTQGPTFSSISVDGSTVHVSCSPVAQVRWRTFGPVGFVDHASEGGHLTESDLPEWFEPRTFVRVELVDHNGKRAWSNPLFVE